MTGELDCLLAGAVTRRTTVTFASLESGLIIDTYITQKYGSLSFCVCVVDVPDDTDDIDALLLSLSVRFRGISTAPKCFILLLSTRGIACVFRPSLFCWLSWPVIPFTKFRMFSIFFALNS